MRHDCLIAAFNDVTIHRIVVTLMVILDVVKSNSRCSIKFDRNDYVTELVWKLPGSIIRF